MNQNVSNGIKKQQLGPTAARPELPAICSDSLGQTARGAARLALGTRSAAALRPCTSPTWTALSRSTQEALGLELQTRIGDEWAELTTKLIVALNPLLRGWGEYYKCAHARDEEIMADRASVSQLDKQLWAAWQNSPIAAFVGPDTVEPS
jgi:hypothetical protein